MRANVGDYRFRGFGKIEFHTFSLTYCVVVLKTFLYCRASV